MYICLCNAVTDHDIREAVQEGVCTFNQLQSCLGVATCCGKCAPYAQEILHESLVQHTVAEDFKTSTTPVFSF